MKLTDEQKEIIESSGNVKIHAVAGSGKTSTLIEIAKSKSRNLRILYLAFNRSVRKEAQCRFSEAGVKTVRVETAHSLAYFNIVNGSKYKICQVYRPADLVSLLKISPINKDPFSALLLAGHVQRFATYFCNQSAAKVSDLDYSSQIRDNSALTFVKKNYSLILDNTRKFLAKMNSGEIDITHEFYLKKFQLSKPKLPYDYILFDEGQDASPVMLDIFMNQDHARKIIVGDIHQQIYSWRYAVNALSDIDFKNFTLTTSFRFPQRIADLAMQCLMWKQFFNKDELITIKGIGKSSKSKLKATLARTNLSLLKTAIDMTSGRSPVKNLYFEGNLSSYTYASEGASIYDVLSLYLNNRNSIRDPAVAAMKSFDQLTEYAEISEDRELLTLIEMVSEYGKDLPKHMKLLKDYHVTDENRSKAEMIFSTVHRCKGLEYDAVTLKDDFVNENSVKRLSEKKNVPQHDIDRMIEEINLVYVAITRSRNKLTLPSDQFEDSPANRSTMLMNQLQSDRKHLTTTRENKHSFNENYSRRFQSAKRSGYR